MKYYIIYQKLYDIDSITTTGIRFVCIIEHQEVAKDFCRKNPMFYYEEVEIKGE